MTTYDLNRNESDVYELDSGINFNWKLILVLLLIVLLMGSIGNAIAHVFYIGLGALWLTYFYMREGYIPMMNALNR